MVTFPAVKPAAVPVIFVPIKKVGVSKAGVIRIGEVDKTTLPVPVEFVTPVPPFATATTPVNTFAVDEPIGPVNPIRP